MSELVVIVPVLRRPHRVELLLESAHAAADCRVLFVANEDDDAELAALKDAGAEYLTIPGPEKPGGYSRKINHGYRESTEPLLFLGADDLHFHPGWFDAATQHLQDAVHVIGTNDLGNPEVIAGRHATHSLVTREYVDRLGTVDRAGEILHEGYHHEFCDNEFVRTAQARHAWAFAGDSIVEHLHPHWGKAPTDELYDQQPERMRTGRKLFRRREPLFVAERYRWQEPALPRSSTSTGGVTVITASLPSRASVLAEAISSVAAQTTPVAHLIAVDASASVAEARTRLVESATTEWVAFLDDDDLLDADHLEVLLAHAGGADVVIPYCRFDGPPLPTQYCNRSFERADLGRHGVFPITVLARRQAVLDAGAFRREDRWEDWALWNRMADQGARFVVIPRETWTYRTCTEDRRTVRIEQGTA